MNLLLVEDNDHEAELMGIVLRESGCVSKIFRAESLREGTRMMETTEFGAVILDLNLPDSAGINTLRSFLDAHPAAQVVVLTGDDRPEMAIAAAKTGAKKYLSKGRIDAAEIISTIEGLKKDHARQRQFENGRRLVLESMDKLVKRVEESNARASLQSP